MAFITAGFNGSIDSMTTSSDAAASIPSRRYWELNATVTSVCANDLTPAAIEIGQGIKRLIGDACLTRAVAAETCLVIETRDSAPNAPTTIPPCGDGAGGLCYDLVGDVTCATGPHKRLAITRSDAPAADAWIAMSVKKQAPRKQSLQQRMTAQLTC